MKKALKYFLPFVFIIFILTVVWKTGFIDLRSFPEPKGEKTVTLNCTYKGEKLEIREVLYESINEYYGKDPKKSFAGYEYYASENEKDQTVRNLTAKIKGKGEELGLTTDQTMDLATCFVQNIPYDSEKAKVVLSSDPQDVIERTANGEMKDRFPYETLYDNKGICTDKSYLEALILKEMGYGSVLLTFNKERHMAVGVKTAANFSSFGTGYAYVETTNTGYRVGQLPTIDKGVGGAKKAELEKIKEENGQNIIPELPVSDFSPPSNIIKVSEGREYARIVEITNEINRLKELTNEINNKNSLLLGYKKEVKDLETEAEEAKNRLEASEAEVGSAKAAYSQNPTNENYQRYRKEFDEYTSVYESSKSVIDTYNSKISQYNDEVKEINSLIDEYNQLLKND